MAYNNSDLFDNFNNQNGRGGTYVPGQGTKGRGGTSVPGQGSQNQQRGGTSVPGQGGKGQQRGGTYVPGQGGKSQQRGGTDIPGQGGGSPSDYVAPPDEENISELLRFLYRTRSWVGDIDQFRERVADMFRKGDTLTGFSGKVYTIDGAPVFGGESAVLSCRDNRAKRFAAKIYYDLERNKAINTIMPLREKIIELTRSSEAEGSLLPITDVGFAVLEPGMNNYVEFQPFCKDGDVSDDGVFSVEQLKPLIRSMNEALHLIHTKGFIHRDVKPENIYKSDKGAYLLGDFGVVSMSVENRRMTQTITGSPDYMAPEMLLGDTVSSDERRFYISNAVDYYALGLTLASLFAGRYIFAGLESNRMYYMANSLVPLPAERTDSEKEQFLTLVTGLCQYDVNRRFGYEEVRRWLADPDAVIAPQTSSGVWTRPFSFSRTRKVSTPEEFFKAATENEVSWDGAVKMLYQGLFFDYFRNVDQSLASYAKDLVEVQYPQGNTDKSHEGDTALFCFLRMVYPMGEFVWRGKKYASLSEIGNAAQQKENEAGIAGFLSDRLLSVWLDNSEGLSGADASTRQLIHEIEELSRTNNYSPIAVAWLGFAFGSRKSCSWKQTSITNAGDFVKKAVSSAQFFYGDGGTMDLLKHRNKQSMDLFGLICSFGYKDHLLKMFSKKRDSDAKISSLLFVFLENLAGKNASLTEQVRKAYLTFGPLGYLGYTRTLVNKGIYKGTTPEDQKILTEVKNYKYDRLVSLTIDEEGAELASLLRPVTYIKDHLQNNPYLAEIGIFRGKTMRCSQADGLFCCTFLGAEVPMGFSKSVS
ncbi:MAG: protein kinase [Lachnospiraceae bacterium]|nr:protein kinase [Lachnospiraceae bacterium]